MSCSRCSIPACACAHVTPAPPYISIRNAPGLAGIRLLFPNGPVKYEAGQLLKLLREHCGADVCATCADATTAVAAEVPVAEPAEFVAVTTTRNVLPTSVETSRYVIPVG